MLGLLITVGFLLTGTVAYFVVYSRLTGRTHPMLQKPEKRTYLFEDEDGEKRNPFGSLSEGAREKENREYPYDPDEFE